MRSTALFIIAASFHCAVCAAPLPDKQALFAEMDALVDRTPLITEKNAKASARLIAKGIKEHDKGKYEKAIALYNQALEKDPLSAHAYYELAMAQYAAGQLEDAYRNAVRAEALNPNAEGIYVIIANIEDDAGFPDQAIETYDRLLKIEPKSFMAWLNKGIAFLKRKDHDAAEECFKKASELNDKHPSPYYFLFISSSMQGYNYDEEIYIAKFMEVGNGDQRMPIVEERKKELEENTINVDSYSTSLNMIEQLLRLTWRRLKHRENYPTERGYRPSLKEEREVVQSMIEYADENQNEKFDRTQINHLKQIADAGLLDARNYLLLKDRLGAEDLAWGEQNKDKIRAYQKWLKQ